MCGPGSPAGLPGKERVKHVFLSVRFKKCMAAPGSGLITKI